MGATPDQLDIIAWATMEGLLPKDASIIDVGCQQLYNGSPERMAQFFRTLGRTPPGAARLQELSGKLAFIGHALIDVGYKYQSIDIVEAPYCWHYDLNHDTVPPRLMGAFDLVLNFGTTEHVLNQYNAFKTLHDFTRPGGLIYSYLIGCGHEESDHGLVHYSDRFVNLLLNANSYESVWRQDSGNRCTWIVYRKTVDAPFLPVIDVQEGEGLPPLRKQL